MLRAGRMSLLKTYFFVLLDLIYPAFCPRCKIKIRASSELPICQACLGQLKIDHRPSCRRCGNRLKGSSSLKDGCGFCRKKTYFFDRAFCATKYTGVAKLCIHLFKYKRKTQLAKPLARIMLKFIKGRLKKSTLDLIIPVPLHRSKLTERGFNQAELLAKILASGLNKKISCHNLCRVKKTRSQFNLKKSERFKNVESAFTCRYPDKLSGKSVLLVDDIFTTGATLNECAFSLKDAGAKTVMALTMAR